MLYVTVKYSHWVFSVHQDVAYQNEIEQRLIFRDEAIIWFVAILIPQWEGSSDMDMRENLLQGTRYWVLE